MIHDKYPESVNEWLKAFGARGYYVATVSNITEEAVREIHSATKRRVKKRRYKKITSFRGRPV